jgi:N-acetylneuraminic acid mutarotase
MNATRALFVAAALSLLPGLIAATWERRAPLPVPNGGFIAAALGNRLVVAGGTTWEGETKRWLDRIWTYDPAADRWSEAGGLAGAVAYPVSAQTGDTLWWAGGSGGAEAHRALWTLGSDLRPRLVSRLAEGFVYAAGAAVGLDLHVIGGTDDQAALDRSTRRFRSLDLGNGRITELPPYPESGFIIGTAAAVGGRIFVFGGARWDEGARTVVNHAGVHAFETANRRWSALPSLPRANRGLTAVVLDPRRIYLAGGYVSDEVGFTPDAFIFDPEKPAYHPATPLPYAGMVTLVRSGEWVYCLGGEDRKRHRSAAVHRFRAAEL